MALRLQKVLPKIINTDQQGFIKNIFIGFNIIQIQDIIDYADILNIDGIILFLDFKKAFDTVEWNFMIHVLKKFGFNTGFIDWVQILYKNINSCIINNGWKSQNFNLERGVKQGCPLSALLFIIVAEILSSKIRANRNIQGICVKLGNGIEKKLKITQLADDTTIFLKDIEEIPTVIDEIREFGSHSGLKLNISKTSGLMIGKSKMENDKCIYGIKFEKHVKALGTYFGTNKAECEQLNWQSKIDSCQNLINTWTMRFLTFYGKITVIKSLILPKIAYLCQSIATPKNVIDKLNTMIFKFLWSNKHEKIKRNTLIGPKHSGGLDMPDVQTFVNTLQIKWINSLNDNSIANWKILPSLFLNQYGSNLLIFKMNVDSLKSLPKPKMQLSTFYVDIIEAFIKLRKCKSTANCNTYLEIRNQIIWGNRIIKNKGKCLLFKSWINSDLICIDDITRNGKLSEELVYDKLVNKTNWISEFSLLKKCIPSQWKYALQSEVSVKSKIKRNIGISVGNTLLNTMNNKQIRTLLVSNKFVKPYMHNYWDNYTGYTINWNSVYHIINNVICDNRLKQLRFKIIHKIVPTNEKLFTWKIVDSPNCLRCNQTETLEHFFLTCPYVDPFWTMIAHCFEHVGIHKSLRSLNYIAIGYKPSYEGYNDINIILSYISYCIYKSYMVSERRTRAVNILRIFTDEIKNLQYLYEIRKTPHPILNKFVTFFQNTNL